MNKKRTRQLPMKQHRVILMMLLIAILVMTGCGNKDAESNRNTTEQASATSQSDLNTQSVSMASNEGSTQTMRLANSIIETVNYETVNATESVQAVHALVLANDKVMSSLEGIKEGTLQNKVDALLNRIETAKRSLFTEEELQNLEGNQASIKSLETSVYVKAKSIAIGLKEIYAQNESLTPAQMLQLEKLLNDYNEMIETGVASLTEVWQSISDGIDPTSKTLPSYETIYEMQLKEIDALNQCDEFLDEAIDILDISVILPNTPEEGTTLKTNFGLILPTEKVRVGKDFIIDGIQALTPSSDYNDPGFVYQWGLAYMHAPEAWQLIDEAISGINNDAVRIAILDTGIDATHEDLKGRVDLSEGYDFVNKDADASDDNGHGTHVAGIVAANANNNLGIIGVTGDIPVTLIPIKILDENGSGTLQNVLDGINKAIALKVDVINLSVGMTGVNSEISDALDKAMTQGIVVVVAAGNDNVNCDGNTMTASKSTVTVSATSPLNRKTNFSNFGESITLGAPGKKILSTVSGNQYEAWDGTSMAAPMVTGVVAMIKYVNPNLDPSQINEILSQTAFDILDSGIDDYTGAGLVDAYAAVGMALQ